MRHRLCWYLLRPNNNPNLRRAKSSACNHGWRSRHSHQALYRKRRADYHWASTSRRERQTAATRIQQHRTINLSVRDNGGNPERACGNLRPDKCDDGLLDEIHLRRSRRSAHSHAERPVEQHSVAQLRLRRLGPHHFRKESRDGHDGNELRLRHGWNMWNLKWGPGQENGRSRECYVPCVRPASPRHPNLVSFGAKLREYAHEAIRVRHPLL